MGKGKRKSVRRTKDVHHFYWPKRIYKKRGIKNKLIELSYEAHHSYHNFFMARCKAPESRDCRDLSFCRYESICCYNGTCVPFGREVI